MTDFFVIFVIVLEDGSFPVAMNGEQLPNARKISRILYSEKFKENENLSLNALAFGQFLAHDLSFIYLSKYVGSI